MNLDDLKFTATPPTAIATDQSVKVAAAENTDVFEDDVCARCKVEGSMPLANGTCDTCGAAWEVQDDFQVALELLSNCQMHLEQILKDRKLVNKMGSFQETELRDLAMTLDDFLDTYSEDADAST